MTMRSTSIPGGSTFVPYSSTACITPHLSPACQFHPRALAQETSLPDNQGQQRPRSPVIVSQQPPLPHALRALSWFSVPIPNSNTNQDSGGDVGEVGDPQCCYFFGDHSCARIVEVRNGKRKSSAEVSFMMSRCSWDVVADGGM